MVVYDSVRSGNIFYSNKMNKPTWTKKRTRLKNNSFVHKQRGLIRAGGSSFSKSFKAVLVRPSLNDLCAAPLSGKIPQEIRSPKRGISGNLLCILSVCKLLLNSTSVLTLSLLSCLAPFSLPLASSNMRVSGSRTDSLWPCVMTKHHRPDSS